VLESLGNVWGLLVAVLGFGAIIFIHELGHFLAARWAGIRVFSFAVGFGPAALAWRKGIGLRRGTTNPATMRALRERLADTAPSSLEKADHVWPDDIGKTEYRLNWLPLGGYVQMRGQDDVNPGAAEADRGAGDSFVDKPVWKRMVVISAGVVMNVILALALYVVVYAIGKPASPPIVGGAYPDSPAAAAVAVNAESAGVTEPGIRNGDVVLSINGTAPREFADVWLTGALASASSGVSMEIQRPGVPEPLLFTMETQRRDGAEFRGVGLVPAVSTRLVEPQGSDRSQQNLAYLFASAGIPQGASRVVSIDGRETDILPVLDGVFSAESIPFTYEIDGGVRNGTLRGVPELQSDTVETRDRLFEPLHVAGFVPPMQVGTLAPDSSHALLPGDVFVRIGRVEWPGPVEGIHAIRESSGREVDLEVLRDGERLSLTAHVSPEGSIGFYPMQAIERCVITRPLPASIDAGRAGRAAGLAPGTVIETVNGAPIDGYSGLRAALAGARADTPIELGVLLPIGDDERITTTITLTQPELDALRELGWSAPPFFSWLFEPAEITLQASNPLEAMAMGVADTQQMILRTYLTLVRLVEGTVEVEQLRGPVGIAHIGTQVAQRSLAELLFFFAVISANLAVLNFLPIPIADGGMMVFLIIEGVTGKPVSPAVQNAAALVGVVLLGSVFLLVTFNDLTRLL